MAAVIIGIDPHKGSHTAVAIDGAETQLGMARVSGARLAGIVSAERSPAGLAAPESRRSAFL